MVENIVITQVTTSAIVVAAIQWLKSSRFFPWITKESGAMSRFVSALLAAGAAVGIHTTWDPSAHALTITGLTAFGIALATWEWAKSFVLNELIYRSTVKPQKADPPIVVVNQPAQPPAGFIGGGGGLLAGK